MKTNSFKALKAMLLSSVSSPLTSGENTTKSASVQNTLMFSDNHRIERVILLAPTVIHCGQLHRR
ncbi:hypothetical protein BPSY_1447 [Bifidobacterium psychraerophilum]|uniref:Uncharacterized protein n=1 Tax=Bifidobacterium psychraerophilum TaxID=218140 RepID=A0A087CCN9_9BIFI|nr:hypothetical protein BPSY_1447 [Bifidobacterium psychraerophilum]